MDYVFLLVQMELSHTLHHVKNVTLTVLLVLMMKLVPLVILYYSSIKIFVLKNVQLELITIMEFVNHVM